MDRPVHHLLPRLLLAVLLAGHLWLTWGWMHDNGFFARPPTHDASGYRLKTWVLQTTLREEGPIAWLGQALEYEAVHPPLMEMVASLVNTVTGNAAEPEALWHTTALFWVLLLLGMWRLARNFGGPWFALAVVGVTGCCPGVVVEARPFWSQMPLSALVIWALDALVRSRGFLRPGASLLFGLLAALAVFTKIIAPVYLGGAALVAVILGVRRARHWARPARNVGLALVPVLLLLVPWFWLHLDDVFGKVDRVVGEQGQRDFSSGLSFWDPRRWISYPMALVNSGFGLPLAVLLAGSAVGGWWFRRAASVRPSVAVTRRDGALVLWGSAGIAYPILTLGQVQASHAYYAMSFIPLGALLLVAGARRWPSRRARAVFGCLVAVAGIWLLVLTQRPFPEDRVELEWGGFHLVGRSDYSITGQAHVMGARPVPEAEGWPNREFVHLMLAHSRTGRPHFIGYVKPTLHQVYMNLRNFLYEADRVDAFIRMDHLISSIPPEPRELCRWLSDAEFITVDCAEVCAEDLLPLLRRLGFRARLLWHRRLTPVSELGLIAISDAWEREGLVAPATLEEDGVQVLVAEPQEGWRLVGFEAVPGPDGSVAVNTFWRLTVEDPPPVRCVVEIHRDGQRVVRHSFPLVVRRWPGEEDWMISATTGPLPIEGGLQDCTLRARVTLSRGGSRGVPWIPLVLP